MSSSLVITGTRKLIIKIIFESYMIFEKSIIIVSLAHLTLLDLIRIVVIETIFVCCFAGCLIWTWISTFYWRSFGLYYFCKLVNYILSFRLWWCLITFIPIACTIILRIITFLIVLSIYHLSQANIPRSSLRILCWLDWPIN